MNQKETYTQPEREDPVHRNRKEFMRLVMPAYVTMLEELNERKPERFGNLAKIGSLLVDLIVNAAAFSSPLATKARVAHYFVGPAAIRVLARRFL